MSRRASLIAVAAATLIAVGLVPSSSRSAEAAGAGKGDIVRWRDASSPIRVWIQDVQPAGPTQRALRVRAALATWSRVRPIRFQLVRDSVGADVRVMWAKALVDPATGKPVNGLTRNSVNAASQIVRADVFLARRRPNGRMLTLDALEAIATHEIGHALGLRHSTDSSDVMFATVQVRGLSSSDVDAARALYGVEQSENR